jgi:hypothetical protein
MVAEDFTNCLPLCEITCSVLFVQDDTANIEPVNRRLERVALETFLSRDPLQPPCPRRGN